MRIILLILVTVLIACNDNSQKNELTKTDTITNILDSNQLPNEPEPIIETPKKYANERFKDVSVEKLADNKFRISGQGQIFEASFNWTVEDGHNELANGFESTDAGAPAWGNFDFTIDVDKERENSTLTLLLYESSAKDGSRQYVLIMPLK